MFKLNTVLTALSIALLLTACTTKPAPEAADNAQLSWAERQTQLKKIDRWNLQGAVAIKTAENKGGNASVSWRQLSTDYTLYLFGPLGMGKIQITGNAQSVSLQRGSQHYTAHSAEQLLYTQMGWTLPVSELYYWIRGLPSPHYSAKTTFDNFNHLINLEQKGWIIEYQQYTGVDGVDLPTRMSLTHPQLRVKLVVSEWQIMQIPSLVEFVADD